MTPTASPLSNHPAAQVAAVWPAFRRAAALLVLALLGACGSGGGDGGGNPPPPVVVGFDLGGSLRAADVGTVDGDTNDPNQDNYRVNDDPFDAQEITTPVTVVGSVNLLLAGPVTGRNHSVGDVEDWFLVRLQAGQVVELFVGLSAGSVNDADLCVISADATSGGCSLGVTDRECVRAAAEGDYYVIVDEFSSASVYNLRISAPGAGGDCENEVLPLSAAVPGQLLALRAEPADGAAARALGEARSRLHERTRAAGLHVQRRPELALDVLDLPQGRSARAALHATLTGGPSRAAAARAAGTSSRKRAASAARQATVDAVSGFHLERRLAKRLRVEGGYASVEPNWILRASGLPVAAFPPADQRYPAQRWHYEQIALPAAMDRLRSLSPQPTTRPVVAVVDDGVMLDHPDITPQLLSRGHAFASGAVAGDADRPEGESLARSSDDSFHGLHVAGTVLAASFDSGPASFGAGVAPMALLLPVRVFGDNGGATSLDVAEGIRYSAGLANRSGTLPPRRADVINLSLGSRVSCPAVFQSAVDAARAAGSIVVAATGNDARNDIGRSAAVSTPANCRGVIAVAALDALRQQTRYSNSGPTVALSAPGGDGSQRSNGSGTPDSVYSAWASFDASGIRRASFAGLDGTSMASPHVAGVMALMRWVNPALTPAQLDGLLAAGSLSDDLGAAGADAVFGQGQVNARKAVDAALSTLGVPPPAAAAGPLVAQPSTLDFGSSTSQLTLRIVATGSAGSTEEVLGVDSDSAAVTATPLTVDAQGRGAWRISINRSVLPATTASYFPRLTVRLKPARSLGVQLAFSVVSATDAAGRSDVGPVYVLVLNPDNGRIDTVRATFASGRYQWRLSGYTGSRAVVVAGTDLDADDLICQLAEVCGGFPVLGTEASMTLDVTANRLDLDFGIQPRTDASVASLRLGPAAKALTAGREQRLPVLAGPRP